jgi:hypothetical protein
MSTRSEWPALEATEKRETDDFFECHRKTNKQQRAAY